MIPSRYLSGVAGLIRADLYPDTWMATRPRGLGTYLIASHDSGSSWKPEFLRMLRRFETEAGGNAWWAVQRNRDWHLHHIVELRHCAELDVRGWLARGRAADFARLQAPCVLLAWEEHNHYTFATLGAGETAELFLTDDPWKRVVDRSAQAVNDATTQDGRQWLHRKVARFRELYAAAYSPEPLLGAIASRVLDHFDDEIRTLG